MNKEDFIEKLQDKLNEWDNQLVILQDDANRADSNVQDEYLETVKKLYRLYKELESHVDELEEMTEETFEEEKEILDQKMQDFKSELQDARNEITDV